MEGENVISFGVFILKTWFPGPEESLPGLDVWEEVRGYTYISKVKSKN